MVDRAMAEALPGYELGAELGRGAMGEVIAAQHRKLDRQVAIKRLPKTFALDPEVVERFGREARVLASLAHPHIVPVYDYVEDHGLCLLVMEALPGGTVWDRFRSEGLSMPAACAILVATCSGLQHAHDKRVLHRDVKPDNLLFDADSTVKVADFGIATVLGGEETLATLDGEVLGTPAYMAPEQAMGKPVGPAADVYAAGTMLYELLSGRLPFSEEGGSVALLQRRVREAPAPLDVVSPGVPEALVPVVMRSIERDPAQRYPRAADLAVAITEAAAASWGPDWLDLVDFGLLADGHLVTAGRGSTSVGSNDVVGRVSDTATPGVGTGAVAGSASRSTVRRGQTPPTDAVSRATETPGATNGPVLMRSQRPEPGPSLDLRGVDPREVVPLSDLLRQPDLPSRQVVGAVTLALLALLIAVVGLGGLGSSGGGDLPEGVTVAGVPVPGGGTVHTDLGRPIEVRMPAEAREAATAQLELSVLGMSVGRSDLAPLVADSDGTRVAAPSVQTARLVTSGDLSAELTVFDRRGEPIGSDDFTVRSDPPAYASLASALAVVLAVVTGAYMVSTTKPLRLGRRKVTAFQGMGFLGALAGIDLVLWAWVLGFSVPTWVSIVLCGALGAGASVLASQAILVFGRRRRLAEALQETDGAVSGSGAQSSSQTL